ncbi:MAG: TIM barrel protein, partial [Candidatus Omnitrophica bacterium]|nr:TIM barrel protein [Candidatus Omnitrophota bacterium]
MRFALSTAWNAEASRAGRVIVESILGLGFNKVELNFRFTKEKLSEVLPIVKEGRLEVVSVHNFCPVPEDDSFERAMPDVHSLSSADERERRLAVSLTRRTIETAREFGAKAVVIHSGYVDMPARTADLVHLFRMDKKGSKEYNEIQSSTVAERRQKVKVHFDSLTTSFAELVSFARERTISLGL